MLGRAGRLLVMLAEYVSHSFDLSASGLFGMELPGPWMSGAYVDSVEEG
jgi:hypothetical protein